MSNETYTDRKIGLVTVEKVDYFESGNAQLRTDDGFTWLAPIEAGVLKRGDTIVKETYGFNRVGGARFPDCLTWLFHRSDQYFQRMGKENAEEAALAPKVTAAQKIRDGRTDLTPAEHFELNELLSPAVQAVVNVFRNIENAYPGIVQTTDWNALAGTAAYGHPPVELWPLRRMTDPNAEGASK